MRGVSWACLLLLAAVGASAWMVESNYYSDTCDETKLFTSTIFSGGCQTIDDEYIRLTCAGSEVIAQECFDSACVNCDTIDITAVLGGQPGSCINLGNITGGIGGIGSSDLGLGLKFECTNEFPTIPSGAIVAELFFSAGCTGNPFSWTILNPGAFTSTSSLPDECPPSENGVCISDTSADEEDDETVYEKLFCSGFNAPSGNGNGAPNCTVDGTSCNFYWDCMETTLPCASTDYALAFGYATCDTYVENVDQLSATGQEWLTDVNACLQTNIKTALTASGATCASVRDAAYASHAQCFFGNVGTCFPPQDWSIAMSIAYDGAQTANSTVSALNNTGCFANYPLAGVWLLTNVQSGSYLQLLEQIAALAGVNYSSISILDSTTTEYTWSVGYEVKRGFGSGGTANITFTAHASDATSAAQVATTFNTAFTTQTTWSGAKSTSCDPSNPTPCAATTPTAVYGAEPPADSGDDKSSSASVLAASVVVGVSAFLLL